MSEVLHRRAGGREGGRALRAAPMGSLPAPTREIPTNNLLPDAAVELFHLESVKILEEVD